MPFNVDRRFSTASLIWLVFLWLAPGPGAAADFVFRPVGIKIYQADAAIESRVPGGPMRLGVYVHSLSRELREIFEARPAGEGFGGAIVVIARPGPQTRHWLLTSTALPAALESAIHEALATVRGPTVRDGPIAFALLFEAWGGHWTAPPAPALPTPPEWFERLGQAAQYPLDDADLDRIWAP